MIFALEICIGMTSKPLLLQDVWQYFSLPNQLFCQISLPYWLINQRFSLPNQFNIWFLIDLAIRKSILYNIHLSRNDVDSFVCPKRAKTFFIAKSIILPKFMAKSLFQIFSLPNQLSICCLVNLAMRKSILHIIDLRRQYRHDVDVFVQAEHSKKFALTNQLISKNHCKNK